MRRRNRRRGCHCGKQQYRLYLGTELPRLAARLMKPVWRHPARHEKIDGARDEVPRDCRPGSRRAPSTANPRCRCRDPASKCCEKSACAVASASAWRGRDANQLNLSRCSSRYVHRRCDAQSLKNGARTRRQLSNPRLCSKPLCACTAYSTLNAHDRAFSGAAERQITLFALDWGHKN